MVRLCQLIIKNNNVIPMSRLFSLVGKKIVLRRNPFGGSIGSVDFVTQPASLAIALPRSTIATFSSCLSPGEQSGSRLRSEQLFGSLNGNKRNPPLIGGSAEDYEEELPCPIQYCRQPERLPKPYSPPSSDDLPGKIVCKRHSPSTGRCRPWSTRFRSILHDGVNGQIPK